MLLNEIYWGGGGGGGGGPAEANVNVRALAPRVGASVFPQILRRSRLGRSRH